MCALVCPVHAIVADDDIPEDKKHWIEVNAERSKALPVVDEKHDPLPGAEDRKKALGY